jgi:hypothetical protein
VPPGQQGNNVCEFQEGSSYLYALNLITSGPAFDKKQDDDGNDKEEFDDGKSGGGNSKTDRAIKLNTPGMVSSAQLINTKDGTFALVGFQTVDVDDQEPPRQTFWRQVDE